ncbi:MAG: hypothetical protein SGI92_17130 [Bryobacteraceae bacterium]|nr:hypothetical protein [Bryobacteraceae bacterium]
MGFLTIHGGGDAVGGSTLLTEAHDADFIWASPGIALDEEIVVGGVVQGLRGLEAVAGHAPLVRGELGDEVIFLHVGGSEASHGGIMERFPVFDGFPFANVIFRGSEPVPDGVAGGYGFACLGFGATGAASIGSCGFLLFVGSRFRSGAAFIGSDHVCLALLSPLRI